MDASDSKRPALGISRQGFQRRSVAAGKTGEMYQAKRRGYGTRLPSVMVATQAYCIYNSSVV